MAVVTTIASTPFSYPERDGQAEMAQVLIRITVGGHSSAVEWLDVHLPRLEQSLKHQRHPIYNTSGISLNSEPNLWCWQ